jgi:hypothetical protein
VADDPEEELFAVVDEEAAMGGVCEFEMGLLMDSVVVEEAGMEMRSAGCTIASWILPDDVVAESQIRARGGAGSAVLMSCWEQRLGRGRKECRRAWGEDRGQLLLQRALEAVRALQ